MTESPWRLAAKIAVWYIGGLILGHFIGNLLIMINQ